MTCTKTVYSFTFPETAKMFHDTVNQPAFDSRFERPWESNKPEITDDFFGTWRRWTASVVSDTSAFSYSYPTNGSSEGIREIINHYANTMRLQSKTPYIVTLDGEYEGYKAFAQPLGIQVNSYEYSLFVRAIPNFPQNTLVILSNPSAVNGNLIKDFDLILHTIAYDRPDIQVMIDLTYVGCVPHTNYHIDLNHDCVKYVVFSLSKPFGVYYHRIGGCFSKEEIPGLYGNMWFRNLSSLLFGAALMKQYAVDELPKKYLDLAKQSLPVDLNHSDVWLLGNLQTASPELLTKYKDFLRTEDSIRICLTPLIWNKL